LGGSDEVRGGTQEVPEQHREQRYYVGDPNSYSAP